MHNEKYIPLIRIQLLFAAAMLAIYLLSVFLLPDLHGALVGLYTKTVEEPPLFTLDGVERIVQDVIALISQPR